jgi:AraC family transcriptional activator of pobA
MKRLSRELPRFALYGDNAPIDNAEFVHVELLETRSLLHDRFIVPHMHRGLFQLLVMVDGHASAQIDNMQWECEAASALAVPPGTVHTLQFSETAKGYALWMNWNLVESVDLFVPLFERARVLRLQDNPEVQARLTALLEQLVIEARGPRYGRALLAEWLGRSVLLLLVRLETERRVADEAGRAEFDLFSRFRALLEEHYREQWQVGQYAEVLEVSSARLNRACQQIAGKSAFEMTQDRLMLQACRTLIHIPTSVARVGEELGFHDPAYFSRLFRKRMGVTPKEFRDRALSGTETDGSTVPARQDPPE